MYRNYFHHKDHVEISQLVKNLDFPWVVTYDAVPEIINIYNFSKHTEYELSYTVESKRLGKEVMFYNKITF